MWRATKSTVLRKYWDWIGLLAEPEMGNRHAAGLLGVVLEVALAVHVGVVGDDLDRVLVRPDRAVRAVAPELAADRAGEFGVQDRADRDRKVGDVVLDPDGEAVGAFAGQVVVDGLDHGRGEFLGGQAVAAADDLDVAAGQGHDDVEVERFADGPGFLGPVEDGDPFDRLGQGRLERLHVERPVEADLDQPELGPAGVEVIDRLLGGFRARAHHDDDVLGVGGPEIIEEVVLPADRLGRPCPCSAGRGPGRRSNPC